MTHIHDYENGYIKLVRMLKLVGLYGRYIINMQGEYNYECIGTNPFVLSSIRGSLGSSFSWRKTEEGDGLWRLIASSTFDANTIKGIKRYIKNNYEFSRRKLYLGIYD